MSTEPTVVSAGQRPRPSRDLRLDSLKGFLIIMVLVGHSGFTGSVMHPQGSFAGTLITRLVDYLPQIYYFHMALFFSVAATHAGPIGWAKLLRRATMLAIPLAFWLCWPVLSYFANSYLFNAHRPPLIPFVTGPVWHWLREQLLRIPYGDWNRVGLLWFLPAMTVFVTLCVLEARIERACARFAGGVIATRIVLVLAWVYLVAHGGDIAQAHVAGHIPWGIDVAAYLLPLGVFHRWLYQNEAMAQRVSGSLVVAALVLGETLLTVFEPLKTYSAFAYRVDLAQFSVAVTPLGIAGFVLLTSGLFIAFLKMRPSRVLAWIGYYSLPIYLMHMPLLDGDPMKAHGWIGWMPATWAPGTVETIHYVCRLGIALVMPMAISTAVATLLPFGRYLGFVTPPAVAEFRDRLYRRLGGSLWRRRTPVAQ